MRVTFAILLLLSSAAASSADWPKVIEIFIDVPVKVKGVKAARGRGAVVEILDVSAATQLEFRLSRNLPSAQGAAIRQGRKRLRSVTAKEKSEVLDGVRARYRAEGYGIDVYPSIVIDGRYIVSNTTSIADAVHHWRRFNGQ